MRDSLPVQSALAPRFVEQAWPSLLDQALAEFGRGRGALTSVLICGCGDSHYAALGAEFGLRHWTGLEVRSAPSMLAGRYLLDRADESCLVVGLSASGEVARTVEALEQARRARARTLAITCAGQSSLAGCAETSIVAALPDHPFGPGLISYLASLVSLLAVGAALAEAHTRIRVTSLAAALPEEMARAVADQTEQGAAFAERVADASHGVFLGSGPAFAAAGFAAAKVMEACGLAYHAQDVEEWAHLEYFHAQAEMPTWILTADGREASRVREVEQAATTLGRRLAITRWNGRPEWTVTERESLSPFGLWPGPVAFAQRLMELLGEEPFRSFGGGRSRAEGGGASRIRSSQRLGLDADAGAV